MNWIYLVIASIIQVAWLVSFKFIRWEYLPKINFLKFQSTPVEYLQSLYALIGYLIFGALNVVFFSLATKTIPISTAFAVWMGLAMVGSLAVDAIAFKEPFSWMQLVFTLIIIIGIGGLKATSEK